ncbi:Vps75 protein [Martiniozyma asiatica (nom. inval.)]|nr:Vps75 protein [Martiniozyma asiatica]
MAEEQLDSALGKLQDIEKEIQQADSKVENFKTDLFRPIYERRRTYLMQVPKFWYVVFAQHEDFQEYIRLEDMPFLEKIDDLYVEFWTKPNKKVTIENVEIEVPSKGFDLTISFKGSNDLPDQSITKTFEWVLKEQGERNLESEPVKIKWPASMNGINPSLIRDKAKEENRAITSAEKKAYRLGMRSFFAFFSWTGKKPGKEFRNGEELAALIAEDIFPAALDYYVLAMPGLGDNEEEEDVESEEELDLSDLEEPDRKKQKV